MIDDRRLDWSTMSRARREAAYDNRASVADCAEYLADQERRSAEFRARRPELLDRPYGTHERERCDWFAAAQADAPCMFFVHGGYWQRGSREVNAVVAAGPLACGWSVAMAGYPLAPQATIGAMHASLVTALEALVRDGPAHGLGAGPIVVAGHSAGGHLAALLLDHPAARAALAVSGVYELGPLRDLSLNAALALTDDDVERLSPLRRAVSRKPMTIAYGTAELPPFVEDSRALHAYRAAAHAPGALLPLPAADHFRVLEGFAHADAPLTRALRELLIDATDR